MAVIGFLQKITGKHILTVLPLWSMSVMIKYSELGLNKCKAMKDFAVFCLIARVTKDPSQLRAEKPACYFSSSMRYLQVRLV